MRLALIVAAAALALPAAAHAAPFVHLPAVDTAVLGNGLQIAVVTVDGPPVVAVQVWYHVGSKDDPRDRRGLARMFEYLMFQGSEHVRPGGHADLVGALGGLISGHVDEDSSHFGETLPSDDLETALRLEADRMRGLVLRDVNVQATRELASQQAKGESGAPISAGMAHLLSIAFPTAGYAWPSSGVASDIDSITLADVKKMYDAYYQPNNAVLVVVGKATLADVKAAADRAFGAIPRAETPKRAEAEPEQSGSRREVLPAGPVGLALYGFHIPAARDNDFYPVQLAAMLLGVGDDARLKTRLHAKDAKGEVLAVDGGIDMHVHENPSLLVLVGAFRDPAHQQAVEDAIADEIKRLGASGPDDAELHRVKRQVESGFVFSLEHVDGFAETVGRSWITTGDATSWQHDADKFDKVTAADIERVVKQYLNADRSTLVVVPPKGP